MLLDLMPDGLVLHDLTLCEQFNTPTQVASSRQIDDVHVEIRTAPEADVVRVSDPRIIRPGCEHFCGALISTSAASGALRCISVNLAEGWCQFEFDRGRFSREQCARHVAAAIRAASACGHRRDQPGEAESSATRSRSPGRSDVATEPTRPLDLVMAVGSLAMGAAGLVLPGIPAAPFLLFGATFAIRCSPALRTWLDRRPALRDAMNRLHAQQDPFSPRRLIKLIGTIALMGLFMLLIQPPVALVIGLELALMLFLGFLHLAGFAADLGEVFA